MRSSTTDPLTPLGRAEDEAQFKNILTHMPEVFVAYYGDLEIEPYQAAIMNHARHHMRSLILLPAQHGKSTLMSKWFPIWEIAANPNIRIVLIMKTADDVHAYAQGIQNILTANKKLVTDFGPFKPGNEDIWSTKFFNVAQRTINDEHLTMEFFGAGGKVLGHRSEICIVDDVVTDDTAGTLIRRKDQLRWFREEVQTSPKPMYPRGREIDPSEKEGLLAQGVHLHGYGDEYEIYKVPESVKWPTDISYERVIVTGTRFHPQDLYETLTHDPTYAQLYFDCFWDHKRQKPDKTQKSPLWPSGMPLKKLERERRSLGILSFNKRFRNIAFDQAEMAFHETYINGGELEGVQYPGCLDRTRSFGDFEPEWFKTLGFDPASGSTSRNSTWPSYVLLGTDHADDSGARYVIDIFRRQMGIEDIIDVLLDGNQGRGLPGMHAQYNYDVAKIEVNACQKWLLQHARVVAATTMGVRMEPHQTQGNKWDPEMGVKSMEGMVANGLLRIPYKTPHDQAKAAELIDQMLIFPKGVYDYCMALWFAELAIREALTQYEGYYLDGYSGSFVQNPVYADR